MHSSLKKLILILLPVTAFLFSFAIGRYAISIPQLMLTLYGHYFGSVMETNLETVVFNIRLPRIFAGMLVGAALSTAGAAYQGMFKNPLVSPDILGASAGAGFGACLAIYLSQSGLIIQVSAFLFGLAAVFLAYLINVKLDYDPILGLVLGGILISTLFSSGTGVLKYFADANDKLPAITFWLMGSLSSVNKRDLIMVLIPMLIGFTSLFLVRWRLNVLAFGEEEARALGINTKKLRLIVIISSTLVTAASVSICGMVGWIGLVIPHLARAIVGPNYRVLMPVTFIVGATYLLLIDDVARCLGSVEVPLGILTSLIGVPFFIFIFKKNVRGWK
ncbi:putative ABC transporter permease protein [Pelotomaculum schinkii]|uniref:Putative ABC transporter permease protein n=1 Tax=Pelotomaculum schinkii TaxID=78350 RepID=A0A4Y7RBH7_9FIRM|nr:iron ABC transporter permease [Pelotomaculum schinkii]TEB06061.1 putative ABC transporter permease protein [Pelotomaculum schinkii]